MVLPGDYGDRRKRSRYHRTEIAYGPTRNEIAYVPTRVLPDERYGASVWCCTITVLSLRMVLHAHGTELAYGATRSRY
eukprot:2677492-Rhodomonas_salina.1